MRWRVVVKWIRLIKNLNRTSYYGKVVSYSSVIRVWWVNYLITKFINIPYFSGSLETIFNYFPPSTRFNRDNPKSSSRTTTSIDGCNGVKRWLPLSNSSVRRTWKSSCARRLWLEDWEDEGSHVTKGLYSWIRGTRDSLLKDWFVDQRISVDSFRFFVKFLRVRIHCPEQK